MTANKPRVLIVDDESVICDLLTEDLSELGYSCEVAPEGNCALRKMAEEYFDIVLLDIRLPGMTGVELLREIKLKYRSAVIMMTAVDDVTTAVTSMKLGALDYIVKPFSLDMLNSSISSALTKNTSPAVETNNIDVNISTEERELREIDAIANGIEAKLDFTDKRSTVVTQKTIEIAKELGFPEERIKQWEEKRAVASKKHLNTIKKFNKNAMAQVIMGVTKEVRVEDNLDKREN
jgi:DNA-binding response OmpR family regulator